MVEPGFEQATLTPEHSPAKPLVENATPAVDIE